MAARHCVEWNYGEYEGRQTSEILAERPDWQLFRDLRHRSEASKLTGTPGALPAGGQHSQKMPGRSFILNTTSLSALSDDHRLSQTAVLLWNDVHDGRASNGQGRSDGREHDALTINEMTG